MGWLKRLLTQRREKEAKQIICAIFDEHDLEVAPDFPNFVDWLENAPLHESAARLAKILRNDPRFPREGPYSSIRAYFDEILVDELELNEMAGQLAQIWIMEEAKHPKIRVKAS